MDSIQDVEEIVPWRTLVLGIGRRKELGEIGVLLQIRPEAPDRELVIVRNGDPIDLSLLEELFLLNQDLLEEVFSDKLLFRQVILD